MTTEPRRYTVEESRAFVEMAQLAPTASGPLDGLTFAVKDLIDVASCKTGCGNPSWRDEHPAAAASAVCVEQLLAAGARCVGRTVTDEMAFSLLGENHFHGTPLNPRAPDRVPGGSSSGSASAVACGLADFALGTDTGGSVRVPAGNCGLFGLRPSHGAISVAGVVPFAPTFDTVGVFARTADVLVRAASVLLACDVPSPAEPGTIHLISEAFALADPEVSQALEKPLGVLRGRFGDRLRQTSIRAIDGETGATALTSWYEAYSVLQWAETWNSLGAWVVEAKPAFGPATATSFELPRNLDRRRIGPMVRRRETYCRRLAAFLGPNDLICIPTAPAPAPLKGTVRRDQSPSGYFPRTLSLTALAGVGRLPQVTLPLAEVGTLPVGLSLLAVRGQDALLLSVAQSVAATA